MGRKLEKRDSRSQSIVKYVVRRVQNHQMLSEIGQGKKKEEIKIYQSTEIFAGNEKSKRSEGPGK